MISAELLSQVRMEIGDNDLRIVDQNLEKPWGGYFRFDEAQVDAFASKYFPDLALPAVEGRLMMSPKFLMVNPDTRLSWQYHDRRSEIWRVLDGPVGVMVSKTDQETPLQILKEGEEIRISQGQRHRLVGLAQPGLVAEIWTHTDPANPSAESDIIRVQDDHGRLHVD